MSKFEDYIMKPLDVMQQITDAIVGNTYMTKMFLNQPLGLAAKNYNFMRSTLMRNIGDSSGWYDGYATPIGGMSDPNYNFFMESPWYQTDFKKNGTINYFDYINKSYYANNGGLDANNFLREEVKMGLINPNNLLMDFNHVGVFRGYDANNYSVNPNSITDTRLGEISKFYLDLTMHNAKYEYDKLKGESITNNAYDYFGYDGDLGIRDTSGPFDGAVRPQPWIVGDNIIPWSTSDHSYNSNDVMGGGQGNLNMVQNMYQLPNQNDIRIKFNDLTQKTKLDTYYYPFGNYYDITYSMGMYDSASDKTKSFITKSMLGYDLLLDDKEYTLNMQDGQITETPRKYYAGIGTKGTNYLDKITGIDVDFIKFADSESQETNSSIVRIKLMDAGNDNLAATQVYYAYGEAEGKTKGTPITTKNNNFNDGIAHGKYFIYEDDALYTKDDIIRYTNKQFQRGKYDTLIARFHGDVLGDRSKSLAYRDMTSTAVSQYGISHGRNLLKKNHKDSKTNGYSNPYCRVWTYHSQYSKLQDTIRPFKTSGDGKGLEGNALIESYRTDGALRRLYEKGVKGKNGLVQFAPTIKKLSDVGSIKNCMFSIENLAWKHEKNFFEKHKSQKGPLGGRIMWFPPYDLKFNETTAVDWASNQFIGRGEKIYTYTNTNRQGTLSFKLLIDHPAMINAWGHGNDSSGDVDDVDSAEQALLRFFAGCDVLETKKKKDEGNQPQVQTEPIEVPSDNASDAIYFYVFFPNNYSGVDDRGNGGGRGTSVDPMMYLINGIGANYIMRENETSISYEDTPTTLDEKLFGYEMGSHGGVDKINEDDFKKGFVAGFKLPRIIVDATSGTKYDDPSADGKSVDYKEGLKLGIEKRNELFFFYGLGLTDGLDWHHVLDKHLGDEYDKGYNDGYHAIDDYHEGICDVSVRVFFPDYEAVNNTNSRRFYKYGKTIGRPKAKDIVMMLNATFYTDDYRLGYKIGYLVAYGFDITKIEGIFDGSYTDEYDNGFAQGQKDAYQDINSDYFIDFRIGYYQVLDNVDVEEDNTKDQPGFLEAKSDSEKYIGYRDGANDYFNGNEKKTFSPTSEETSNYKDGYNQGYDEIKSHSNVNVIKDDKLSDLGISGIKTYNKNPILFSLGDVTYSSIPHLKRESATERSNWGYRCDSAYLDQILKPDENYIDNTNFHLNANKSVVVSNMNESQNTADLFSFSDVYCALETQAKDVLRPSSDETFSSECDYTPTNSEEIRKRLGLNGDTEGFDYKYKVSFSGSASSHGYTADNNALNKNRAESIKVWLEKHLNASLDSDKISYDENIGTMVGSKDIPQDVNALSAKIQRFAKVKIEIIKNAINKPNDTTEPPKEENGESNINVMGNNTMREINNARQRVVQSDIQLSDKVTNPLMQTAYIEDDVLKQQVATMSDVQRLGTLNQIEERHSEGVVKHKLANDQIKTIDEKKQMEVGYSDEATFFTELQKNEPFLHHKLVDKIKYFDPAFHSITPEGFNARLTFLHQCTRQGSTFANTDLNNPNRSANNLAFGAPPICVLRLGDFYHTKIIITNMTITYDDTTWDLNDEGIGVMPMMADINLSFEFLGGSDLGGPITRLQNAVSFNYYANTSVYDDRAEQIDYDNEGNITNFKGKK